MYRNFRIPEEEILCENVRNEYLKVNNFKELQQKLAELNYDVPKYDFDVRLSSSSLIEEALINEKEVILVSDGQKVSYASVEFLVKVFCDLKSVIGLEDQGYFCERCYNSVIKRPPLDVVLKKRNHLPVSKKIQLILSQNNQLTSSEIYEKGKPWNIEGKTPKKTIAARCSTLYQKKIIKKEKNKFFQ